MMISTADKMKFLEEHQSQFARWVLVRSGGLENDLFKNGVSFIIKKYHDELQQFYDIYGLDEFVKNNLHS
jgi:hypothetical protein